jgi:hypothetical protein
MAKSPQSKRSDRRIPRAAARVAACTAALCCISLGPVPAAGASSASIKAAIVSYGSKIDVAEGHVLTALGEYKETQNPAGVEAAIANSVQVLGSLKADVAGQPARAPRVRKAKRDIENGLGAVIVGYQDLASAYGELTASPEAAKVEIAAAAVSVKQGQTGLRDGIGLLG